MARLNDIPMMTSRLNLRVMGDSSSGASQPSFFHCMRALATLFSHPDANLLGITSQTGFRINSAELKTVCGDRRLTS